MPRPSYLVSLSLRINHSRWVAAPSPTEAALRARALWLCDREGFDFNFVDQFEITIIDEEPSQPHPESTLP